MKPHETLSALLDAPQAKKLVGSRISGGAAASAAALLRSCAEQLRSAGVESSRTTCAFFVPGRIEVLGKHTDYAGGRSLLSALDRGICLVASPRADARINVSDAGSRERVSFAFSSELQPGAGWHNYAMTVARRVARNFPGPLCGADITFASNLPPAAGMSSSSALIIALFLALASVNDLAATATYRRNICTDEDLADYLAAVESGRWYRGLAGDVGVGTRGGSQDHTAILCARAGELVQYAFDPVRFERSIPLPADHVFIIGASGARAEKTGAAQQRYNRAAEQMRFLSQLWATDAEEETPSLGTLCTADPYAADRLRRRLHDAPLAAREREALLARVDQFIEESQEIVPGAADALSRGDLATFGTLVDRSQELAANALRNQVPETVYLACSARALGCAAASAFGAGFGGSVWALVEKANVQTFLEQWRSKYLERFPEHSAEAAFFTAPAGARAMRLA